MILPPLGGVSLDEIDRKTQGDFHRDPEAHRQYGRRILASLGIDLCLDLSGLHDAYFSDTAFARQSYQREPPRSLRERRYSLSNQKIAPSFSHIAVRSIEREGTGGMMLEENEWLTIKQAAIVQGCSERKMYELVRQLPIGLIGTFYSSLPIRDLNAFGQNREYRLHRSLFRAEILALSVERLPEKAPKAKTRSTEVIGQGFAAWFREDGNGEC